MKYLPLIFFVLIAGCGLQKMVIGETSKIFDTVEYNYKREGNVITRDLKASGTQKVDIGGSTVTDIVSP